VLKDPQVLKELQEHKVHLDLLVTKEQQVHKEPQEMSDTQVHKVL
jgi:hypothetical protein